MTNELATKMERQPFELSFEGRYVVIFTKTKKTYALILKLLEAIYQHFTNVKKKQESA